MNLSDVSRPLLTQDIVFLPSKTPHLPTTTIFFITGNPGCIAYYHSYLTLLSDLLSRHGKHSIDVYGVSLGNFVRDQGPVLGLQGQISYIETALCDYAKSLRALRGLDETDPPTRVILVGHSVGAFIALEVLQRARRKKVESRSPAATHIAGYIGLWPTVTHISKSRSGKKVTLPLQIPYYAFIIGVIARTLVACCSRALLEKVVGFVTGFPRDAIVVTADFIASRRGVEQALFMAKDEMNEIGVDQWDSEVWGAATPSEVSPRPKLLFYFGTNDHWVADHTRDELIKHRGMDETGRDVWKPKMLIDREGIPHSFCIRHSSKTAELTAKWIEQMMEVP